MKKALVLGLILLALSSFAYADGGATVSFGWGRTQFTLATSSSAAGATVQQGWYGVGVNWPNGIRQNLDLAWSNQYTGFNTTLYIGAPNAGGNNVLASIPYINVQNLYGTLKLVPDMFAMYFGQFEGDGWDHFRLDSPHPIHDVNNSNVGRFFGWGLILDVAPKDSGFEAAAFVKVSDPSANGGKDLDLAEQASNYAVAASYTMPNMLKIMAGTNTFGFADGVTPGGSHRNIFASVQLLMVPNLTLWDEFYFAGFDIPSPANYSIWSDELAGQYVMDKLTIVLAAFFGGNSAGGSPDYSGAPLLIGNYTAWAVDPEIYYNVGVANIGLYASIAGTSIANSGIGYYIEPYVKLNNFGLRVSFGYIGSSAAGAISKWEVPIVVDWGF